MPTRELALQTSAIVKEIGKHMPVQVMVTTGGTNLREDIMRLYSPVHILVGTPGRIHDLADKGIADLSHCHTFVMDEVRDLFPHTSSLAHFCSLSLSVYSARLINFLVQNSNQSSNL